MKKIMFNDKYGLTQAVLEGRKTMTRRIIRLVEPDLEFVHVSHLGEYIFHSKDCIDGAFPCYKIGEEVAVAQSYKDIGLSFIQPPDPQWGCTEQMSGYGNKMFVRADLMPHRIRITNIKVERLQDISEEDCLKEGIQEYFPYIDRNPDDKVRTFQYFKEGKIRHRISPASKCFAYLIDDVSGKGTWDKNPYVFVYDFKLIQ